MLSCEISKSYNKPPRKGTVRYEIAKRRKEAEKKRPLPDIKDEMIGNARIIKEK